MGDRAFDLAVLDKQLAQLLIGDGLGQTLHVQHLDLRVFQEG